jgi:hypothetical protein
LVPIAPFQWVGRQNLSRFLLRFVRVAIDARTGGREKHYIQNKYVLYACLAAARRHRVNELGVRDSNETPGSRQAIVSSERKADMGQIFGKVRCRREAVVLDRILYRTVDGERALRV